MDIPITDPRRTTYDAIWQHPAPADLLLRNVRLMLGALADRVQLHNGDLAITRNGHTLVLHQTYSRNFADVQELLEIRHFLCETGAAPVDGPATLTLSLESTKNLTESRRSL